ncbi:MAG: glycosyl hydrolase family 17 protein [Comamonadaceae bacterium]|nr:glycosyl hydrolase family 17 protein [Comamonadaceae bacterium]
MKEMYAFVKKGAKGKEVIISETGWPTKGDSYGDAAPSYINSARYFVETYEWANANHIHVFLYFVV